MNSTLRWERLSWAIGLMLAATGVAHAQVEITEIMFDPITETVWEWVEVRNTSGAALNLDGWVLDDDDDPNMGTPNISAVNGNTIVPAGGVGVLYNGGDLDFDPTRFTNAWGGGITLIPVGNFSQLTPSDAVGLWPSHAAYLADDLMSGSSPRRTFNSAAASVSYATANGYPSTTNGHSIAWNGLGNVSTPSNWVSSLDGANGAHTSVQTILPDTPINSVDDRGTPGVVPAGPAAAGLLITEIMYDPRSAYPDEPAWEWVEVYNNTGSGINFSSTPYVFDDDDDSSLTAANITSGTIGNGGTAVLFNAEDNTLANMTAAWGSGINFIPVSTWTDMANGGDTIAIWNSLTAYQNETQSPTTPRRTTANASAVVAYDDNASLGWPNNDGDGSIFLESLSDDPTDPDSWMLSTDANSSGPQPVLQDVVDHPGGDVGSPGFVPGSDPPTLPGDFNGDNRVDAADYVVWRKSNGSSAQYNEWRSNFGATAGPGSGLAGAASAVPEPTSAMMVIVLAIAGLSLIIIQRQSPRALRSPLRSAAR